MKSASDNPHRSFSSLPDSTGTRKSAVFRQKIAAAYATFLYLPLSGWTQRRRRNRLVRRGVRETKLLQQTALPQCSWRDCVQRGWPRLIETSKANGNVRLSELGVLAQCALNCAPDSNLFEIGTFDGRTTINLALNSPASCRIHTLGLPSAQPPKFPLAPGEKHLVRDDTRGWRYRRYRETTPDVFWRIRQWQGDSATIDLSMLNESCSLVFVDGSHAYDYVLSDTALAFSLAVPGAMILWHDYGIWPAVTRGLEDLERQHSLGLKYISGTSLVFCRAGIAKKNSFPGSSAQ